MDLRGALERKYADTVSCYGHCKQPSSFEIVSDDPVIACFCCMAGYVSRIMVYGETVDLPAFKAFVSRTISSLGTVMDQDLRVATRHAWDAPDLGGDVKVVFWTQNYRRTKVEDPNRPALFLCGRCGSFFIQPVTRMSALCPDCRRSTA